MSYASENRAKRAKPPLLIIFARGEKVRHITLRNGMATFLSLLVVITFLSFFGASSYLILRDDILAAISTRQRYDYEDRVAALRSQVDRLGTENILHQREVHQKVGELLQKQNLIAQRQDRLEPLLGRTNSRAESGKKLPIPTPRPDNRQAARPDHDAQTPGQMAYASETRLNIPWPLRASQPVLTPTMLTANANATEGEHIFTEHSLDKLERTQLDQIETLTTHVYFTAESLQEVLELAGILQKDEANSGGPLYEVSASANFNERIQELDEALGRLDELREVVHRVPFINPLPGAKITSRFGSRRDPILKRMAYHSGIDFRAKRGDLIRATGAGKVTKAGWYGGYGRMIEIDHGRGITTRYAHLHEILVKVGDQIPTAAVIAKAGNSGRSTGPHLHYEIRRHGQALNPLKFITAGRQIAQLL